MIELSGADFSVLNKRDQHRLQELLLEQLDRKKHSILLGYSPYPWQTFFHKEGKKNPQRLLMTGNRCGKTFSGAAEMSYHLTGRYPKDWKGRKFKRPIRAWACGISSPKTRDIIQKELFGEPEDPTVLGTGAIPLDCIVKTTRAPNVPNAFQSAIIRHYDAQDNYDGNSKLGFLSYEMGVAKFMGDAMDVIWLDEQPEYDIFSQCITRTADTGGMVYMTFTPETGMTSVVKMFMQDRKPGMSMTRAGWNDCPHLSDSVKEQLLSVYLPHERDMRSKGEPVFGSGLVFPVNPDRISVEAFEIPSDWPRIAAIDFGWDHYCAVVWLAVDREADVIYVYATYKERKTLTPVIASAIKGRGVGIPCVWPHDGYTCERGSGISIADQFRQEGVNMLPMHFSNPPAPGMTEGSGGFSVEPGLMDMLTRMETGRFKVFGHCVEWFLEFGIYHRKEGKIVALDEDLMSATRYASQSIRFAQIPSDLRYGYKSKITYPDYGVL